MIEIITYILIFASLVSFLYFMWNDTKPIS